MKNYLAILPKTTELESEELALDSVMSSSPSISDTHAYSYRNPSKADIVVSVIEGCYENILANIYATCQLPYALY